VNWNWTLVIGGAALILTEVALGGFAGFDLVLVGSAFMLGGALGLLFHSTNLGLIIGGGLGLLYLAIGRRYVRRKIHIKNTPSNVDAVLGQSGVVLSRVAEHEPGRVKVRSEEWLATPAAGVSGPIEPGTIITVEAVDGVTLKVR
jgi:membrane protein implicated in regulation of membrane protease activity